MSFKKRIEKLEKEKGLTTGIRGFICYIKNSSLSIEDQKKREDEAIKKYCLECGIKESEFDKSKYCMVVTEVGNGRKNDT